MPAQVLVVDDSATLRRLVRGAVSDEKRLNVAAEAANGVEAIEREPIDVVLLDLEMPVMDGQAALRIIKERWPDLPVIIFSSLTATGSAASVQALIAGAADCILKPRTSDATAARAEIGGSLVPVALALTGEVASEVVERRRSPALAVSPAPGASPALAVSPAPGASPALAVSPAPGASPAPAASPPPLALRSSRPVQPATSPQAPSPPTARPPAPSRQAPATPPVATPPVVGGGTKPGIVVVASSTGGPGALSTMLSGMGALNVPMVIVQHIPASFTQQLARRLGDVSGLDVAQAVEGEEIRPGQIRVAPGNYHLLLKRRGDRLVGELDSGPKIQYVRPSADPLFESAVAIFGARVLGVVLTGMGRDGTDGALAVAGAGGRLLVQDEETSVVWGMPGSVAKSVVGAEVLPIDQLGPAIRKETAVLAARS